LLSEQNLTNAEIILNENEIFFEGVNFLDILQKLYEIYLGVLLQERIGLV